MSFPTQLTVLRILLAPIFYVLYAVVEPTPYVLAASVFVVAALSDWYDGYFARLWKLTTPFGAFLDPLADKVLTSAAFIAFASKGMIPDWAVFFVIGRDIYVTVFRILADSIGQPIRTSSLAKYKTFFQMIFICYILFASMLRANIFGEGLDHLGSLMMAEPILYWTSFAITMLTLVTAVQYSYDNARVFGLVMRRYFYKRSPQELS